MPRYTPEKIDKLLVLLDEAEKHQVKALELKREMKRAFHRIRFAMFEDFDLMLRTKLEEEKKKQLELLKIEDPNKFKYRNHAVIAGIRAKKALCDEFKIITYSPSYERWNEFKWRLKKIWENDRKKLIKDGDIDGEIKEELIAK